MKIVDFKGTYEATSIQELETILMRRHCDGVNSFWLSHGNEEYPTLSVLVKNGFAALCYIPEESEAGFMSTGKMQGLKPGGMTTFSLSEHRADDVEILNDAVLPWPAALAAAKEFFSSKGLGGGSASLPTPIFPGILRGDLHKSPGNLALGNTANPPPRLTSVC
jgi:hypothetical protein